MAAMKRSRTLRNRLLSPLVYLAALILLMEDWFWDLGVRLVRLVVAWPPLKALELRIVALTPYAALCAFVLPAVLLLPVKILALLAIASGHPFSGVAVIVIAKIGGAALVARLYVLTLPKLLTLAWFARWHAKFMVLKTYWVGRLKASDAFRRVSMLSAMLRASARRALDRLRPRGSFGARHARRPARMLRRFMAIWRARRR
jgi:hypothetical protein